MSPCAIEIFSWHHFWILGLGWLLGLTVSIAVDHVGGKMLEKSLDRKSKK